MKSTGYGFISIPIPTLCSIFVAMSAMWHLRIKSEFESLLGGAFGLTNLHFDVGRISGRATPSDKNDESTRNNGFTL